MGAGIGVLMIYFLWTLSRGAGGMKESPSVSNIAFLLYEYLGFSGVGPPRSLLRDSRSIEIIRPFIPFMAASLTAYVLLFIFIIKSFRKQARMVQLFTNRYLITFVFGLTLFTLVCSVFQFRFWGRHAIFLLPVLFFYFSQIIDDSISTESYKNKLLLLIVPFLIFMLISDLNIRFNNLYQKENNREASLNAIRLAGKEGNIIWNGDATVAGYYGLKISNIPVPMPKNWPVSANAILPVYDNGLSSFLNNYRNTNSVLVIFTREGFDHFGYYQEYIKKNNLTVLLKDRDFILYSMGTN
jgi:hypothetical protein